MYMNGEYLETLQDLKRCFCIDELVYSYYNGELELFLDKIGAHEKAERIRKIPVSNALLFPHHTFSSDSQIASRQFRI